MKPGFISSGSSSGFIRSSVSRLACLSACLFAALVFVPAHAALLWQADFESYNAAEGAAALTVNGTGANDTFTATSSANLGSVAQEVRKSGVPGFMSGNALYIGGKSEGATISFSIQQNAITAISRGGTSGVLVTSFDVYNSSASPVSLSAEARTSGGRSGNTVFASATKVETSYRVTIVINQSGSAVQLPGSLGDLGDRNIAIYRFDGTGYEELQTSSANALAWSSDVTGFAAGFSLGTSSVGSTYGVWFDNFGAWDSLTDTVHGTSILSLAPGTVLSAIPESSTTAVLLAGFAALAGASGFCRTRRRAR